LYKLNRSWIFGHIGLNLGCYDLPKKIIEYNYSVNLNIIGSVIYTIWILIILNIQFESDTIIGFNW
jgi:hypothetical protein